MQVVWKFLGRLKSHAKGAWLFKERKCLIYIGSSIATSVREGAGVAGGAGFWAGGSIDELPV